MNRVSYSESTKKRVLVGKGSGKALGNVAYVVCPKAPHYGGLRNLEILPNAPKPHNIHIILLR